MLNKDGQEPKDNTELHKLICANISADIEFKKIERQLMVDDQKFKAGEQWPDNIAKSRQAEGRPIQTINRLPMFIKQVTGDARQNKPSIKVHPGEDGDVDVAEIYDGLMRAIQNESNADYAYDSAIENTAVFGFGAWRVKTEYESEDSFNQIVKIERINDPLTVWFDLKSKEPDYSDAERVTVRVSITKAEYKSRWPKKHVVDYGFDQLNKDWMDGEDSVFIAEHWYKDYNETDLYLLEDGSTTTELKDWMVPVNSRKTKICTVKMCLLSGTEILEQADFAADMLPIVGVQGEEDLIDGKTVLRGLVRFAKDPQRMYNYWRTIDTETKALAPKSPVLVTAKQIEGYEDQWQTGLTTYAPYLTYNSDPSAQQPGRLNAGIVDKGFAEAAATCVDEIKATMGLFNASVGEQGNETSGKAILARQREGDTGTFSYIDNVARAIKYTGRLILKLIPKTYDTARVAQVMGADGEKRLQKINQVDQVKGEHKMLDLSAGKYDLVVDVGPSYATKRIEALNAMTVMSQANPQLYQVAGDLIVKAMDWPGAAEIAERLKRTIPPNILADDDQESKIPPEVQSMIEQGQQQMAEMQQYIGELEREKSDKEEELQLKKYEIDLKAEIELQKLAQNQNIQFDQVQAMVQQILMQAAHQPELPDEQPPVNFGQPNQQIDDMSGIPTG